MNTDKILSIPAEEYHAESRSGRYMSSHLLADFRESPELYHRKVTGEIAQAESPALALGRAAHCLILEGRMAFDNQYLVSDGPVNARTSEPYGKATKAYAEWLASQDREVVSARDYGFITKLQKSVWLHDAAAELLDDGSPEGVIRTDVLDSADWLERLIWDKACHVATTSVVFAKSVPCLLARAQQPLVLARSCQGFPGRFCARHSVLAPRCALPGSLLWMS